MAQPTATTLDVQYDTDTIRCRLHVHDQELVLKGTRDALVPKTTGSTLLSRNLTLTSLAWSWALHTTLADESQEKKTKRSHAKAAKRSRSAVEWLAPRQLAPSTNSKDAWCSHCYTRSSHRRISADVPTAPYLCSNCGSPTTTCSAPKCAHMTDRGPGHIKAPGFCAEHRHDIPSFQHLNARINDLHDYHELLEFEKWNWSKGSKIAVEGTVMFGAMWLGGEAMGLEEWLGDALDIGSNPEMSEILGTDALAGETMEWLDTTADAMQASIRLASEGLGAAAGLEAIVAYAREDQNFRIEKLRAGTGPPIIVAKGWMTKNAANTDGDFTAILAQFPESPAYRVHWGAGSRSSWWKWIKTMLGPLAVIRRTTMRLLLFMRQNPWHLAYFRASQGGALLAALLARTNGPPAILVGHSLGARLMASCANTLGAFENGRRLHSVHLLGAAFPARGDWHSMSNAVEGHVWNYHSTRDQVLSKAYRAAQLGGWPAGLVGLHSAMPRIRNRDVSSIVRNHGDYFALVQLRQEPKTWMSRTTSLLLWAVTFQWIRGPRRTAANETEQRPSQGS